MRRSQNGAGSPTLDCVWLELKRGLGAIVIGISIGAHLPEVESKVLALLQGCLKGFFWDDESVHRVSLESFSYAIKYQWIKGVVEIDRHR